MEEKSLAIREANPLSQYTGAGGRMNTSLDLAKPENRKLMLSCLNDCDEKLTEEGNLTIPFVNYFIHDVELRNKETGEISPAVRMVLIDDEGNTHECVSVTLIRSLAAVTYAIGLPPWNPAVKLTIKSKQKGERKIYWFELAE